jgi:hypothetical protein
MTENYSFTTESGRVWTYNGRDYPWVCGGIPWASPRALNEDPPLTPTDYRNAALVVERWNKNHSRVRTVFGGFSSTGVHKWWAKSLTQEGFVLGTTPEMARHLAKLPHNTCYITDVDLDALNDLHKNPLEIV